jgi:hypothetical protein
MSKHCSHAQKLSQALELTCYVILCPARGAGATVRLQRHVYQR